MLFVEIDLWGGLCQKLVPVVAITHGIHPGGVAITAPPDTPGNLLSVLVVDPVHESTGLFG